MKTEETYVNTLARICVFMIWIAGVVIVKGFGLCSLL